ncbi:MAG TPA: hypothetical protein GXZ90_05170 [Clostridiales bacterium]|nr:hypothetical protein [Clostridiales bacterium]
MPTGYTAYIEDGEIANGKDFLLKCARAFDFSIDMKEDSLDIDIPISFEPNTYYKEQLEKSYKELEKCKTMTIEEAQNIIDAEYDENQKYHADAIIKSREINDRYARIRDEVDKWTPPTQEHNNLKEFALNQIDISINNMEHYHQTELGKPKRTAKEYIAIMLKMANENIEYYLKNWNEEVKRTDERNKWINDLRESLE